MRYTLQLLVATIFLSCNAPSPKQSENDNQLIPFHTFLKSETFFHASDKRCVILQDQLDQNKFLNSLEPTESTFPAFSYDDSALVGVVMSHVGYSATFQIDSLKILGDFMHV